MDAEWNATVATAAVDDTATPVALYYSIAKYLWLTVGFVILIFGVCGNVLSFVVLQTASYRVQSTGFLLSTLAVTDTMSLLTGLLNTWIVKVSGYNSRNASHVSCKIHIFLTYCCQTLGCWTLVTFTFDRTISLLIPLKSRQFCTRRRVIIAWFLVACVCCAFYAQIFFIFSVNHYQTPHWNVTECNFDIIYFENGYSRVFYMMDMTLFSIIPSFAIIICNILVVTRLVRMKRQARQLTAPSSEDDNKYRSTIAIVMTISLVFVATTLPYTLHFVTHSYITKETPLHGAIDHVIGTCVKLLYFVNNAVNFLLYCLSAERFRGVMKTLWPSCRAWVTSSKYSKDIQMSRQISRTSVTQVTVLGVRPSAGSA